MKAEVLFRMPLYVVVALWMLRRRAINRMPGMAIVTSVVNISDELAIFEDTEALLAERGKTWLDGWLLRIIAGRRQEVVRAARLGWMVVGRIPK